MHIDFQKIYLNNNKLTNYENINKDYKSYDSSTSDENYKLMSDSISATRKSEVSFGAKKIEIPLEIQKRIIDEYKAGKSAKTISALLAGIFVIKYGAIESFINRQTNVDEIKAEHNKNYSGFKATDEQKKEIKQMYRDGITPGEIAEKFKCNASTIDRMLKKEEEYKQLKEEYGKNTTRFHATEEQKKEIKQMYRDGMSSYEIADKFETNAKTIMRYIKEDDEEYKQILAEHDKNTTHSKPTEEQKKEIKQMYCDGIASIAISDKLGFDKQKVLKILHEDEEKFKIYKQEHLKNNKTNRFIVTEKSKQNIIEAYKQGHSSRSIAEKFGCGKTTVQRYLHADEEKFKIYEQEHLKNKNKIKKSKIKKCKITPQIKQDIISMYKNGLSYKQIADKIGCSESAVSLCLKENLEKFEIYQKEHDSKLGKVIITDEIVDKMVEQYINGDTIENIAKRFGYSSTTITRYIKKYEQEFQQIQEEHIKNSNKTKITNQIKEHIKELYKSGKTIPEIAVNFNCGTSTVYRCLIEDLKQYQDIKIEHYNNYLLLKQQRINKILELDAQGFSYKEIQKLTNENISFIKVAIQVKKHHADFKERLGHRYNEYKFEDLIDRVIEFLINDNSVQNETLMNIIEFLDNKESCTREEKDVLIQFCRELDKIENDVSNANEIIENSHAINEISQWMEEANLKDELFEDAIENIYTATHLLSANQLSNLYDIVENFRPDNKENIEEIDFANEISKFINDKLSQSNVTNKDRNYVKNIIIFYNSLKSNDDESIELLNDAVDCYNSIYGENIDLEEMEDLSEEQQERIGQIISIIDMVNNNSYDDTLGNDYIKFAKLFQNKTRLAPTKVINILVRLEKFFNAENSQSSYIKFNDEFSKDFFGENIVIIYLNEIYNYDYKNVGSNRINAILKKEVLEDKNWTKLTKKEQLDFIRTLEMAKIDLSVSSSGNFNIIKGEGKLNCLIKDEQTNKITTKPVQIVELKILSKWRVFGYVDPNTNQFVFDKLGLDGSDGLDSYKKNFINQHSFV